MRPDDILRTLTVLIKTFQRPRTVNAAIASIRRFYPNLPIIAADDSAKPVDFRYSDIVVHRMPFDSGVSRGRNFLVSRLTTPYFLMCDDDHMFTSVTRLERMIEILQTEHFDLLGCLVFDKAPARGIVGRQRSLLDFQMNLNIQKGTLRFTEPTAASGACSIRCDLVHQCFVARTEAVRASGGWDERLKTADHTEFFLRAKMAGLKIGYTPTVAVRHGGIESERRSPSYAQFRLARLPRYKRIWTETHGIKQIIGRNGTVLTTDEYVGNSASFDRLGNLVIRSAPPGIVEPYPRPRHKY